MKTKEQIDKWLKKQDWFDKFVENLEDKDYDKYLKLDNLSNFISGAFIWIDTPEGSDYWSRIDSTFIKWFYSKNPKDLLKTGMIVEYRDGQRRLVLMDGINKFIHPAGHGPISNWNDELVCSKANHIIEVIYEGYTDMTNHSNLYLDNILKNPGKVIWRREPEVQELTLQQIADKFNIDVKQLRIKDDE